MTDQHPITPPPELLKHWEDQHFDESENYDVMLIQAYQAGADQELEACCEWLCTLESNAAVNTDRRLRAARRPPTIPAGYPSYEQIQRFMFEAGFDVPDPDQEPAFPRAKYLNLAARIVDWSLAQ